MKTLGLKNKHEGVSFIETLLVFSILAVLLVLIIPLQKYILQSQHAKCIAAELFHAIEIARSEALINQKKVILCKSNDQKTCSGDWSDGFIVKTDAHVLYSFHHAKKEGAIFWRAFPYHCNELEFLPTGVSNFENGTFTFYLPGKSRAIWAIAINQAGRARKADV